MAKESKYSSFRFTKPYENSYLLFDAIASLWNTAIGAKNDRNIAEMNLNYQRERNEIEDARYEDETAYNRAFAEDERNYQRAFAEDERDYQRALQQEIFDREDTALERQASSLSAMGINPAFVNMNGLGAGQAVGASSPGAGASTPSLSSRGGQALHNDYRPSESFANLMTPILSLANAMDNINTNGFQRDKLREEADYQRLKNQEQALINERKARQLEQEEEQRDENLRHDRENNPSIEKNTKASAERNQRENEFQEKFGVSDLTDKYTRIATDVSNQAERASNYVEDKVGDLSRSATKTLVDNAREGLKAYNEATKKAQDWIVDKGRKVKNWFKKHTASPEQVRNMYGF